VPQPAPDAGVLGDEHLTVINEKLASQVGLSSSTTAGLARTFRD